MADPCRAQPYPDDDLGAPPADVFDRLPAALVLLDGDWRVTFANAEAERLLDRPRAALLDRPLWHLVPELVGTRFQAALREAASDGAVSFEAPLPGRAGTWVEVHAWPVPGALAVHAVDASARRTAETAARRASARTALLARLAAELSGALDGEAALGRLARIVVPTLADACIVTVVDREGRPSDVGSWHADPARRELLERYTDIRLDWLPPDSPVARALALGTPVTESIESLLAQPVHPVHRAPGLGGDLAGRAQVRLGHHPARVLVQREDPDGAGLADQRQHDHGRRRQAAQHLGRRVPRLHAGQQRLDRLGHRRPELERPRDG